MSSQPPRARFEPIESIIVKILNKTLRYLVITVSIILHATFLLNETILLLSIIYLILQH